MGLVISTFGAALTTLLGVWAGSMLGSRSRQQQWSRGRLADTCAQVLRESSNVILALERLHIERRTPVAEGVLVSHGIDFVAWNEALSMAGLVADHAIVQAALAIDAEIWPAHLQINRGWASDDGDWFKLRAAIETKRIAFVNTARQRLAAPGPALGQLTGRPPADHPIWELRRSYFASSMALEAAEEEADPPIATA